MLLLSAAITHLQFSLGTGPDEIPMRFPLFYISMSIDVIIGWVLLMQPFLS